MNQNEVDNEKSFRKFLTTKYIIDGTLVLLLIISVIFCSTTGLIKQEITGTLFGAIIGYSLGGLRKLHEK